MDWLFILVLIVGITIVIPSIFYLIASLLRASGAAKAAVRLVEENSEAMALLGTPLRVGRWVTGRIGFSAFLSLFRIPGISGRASLSIPLHGTQGKARLNARLSKKAGKWNAYDAYMYVGGRKLVLADGKSLPGVEG